jgi:hypothetical protein
MVFMGADMVNTKVSTYRARGSREGAMLKQAITDNAHDMLECMRTRIVLWEFEKGCRPNEFPKNNVKLNVGDHLLVLYRFIVHGAQRSQRHRVCVLYKGRALWQFASVIENSTMFSEIL